MVAPIECGTNAVVGIPATQVSAIYKDIGHAHNDIGHSHGKSKSTQKIQHQREKQDEHRRLSRGDPAHRLFRQTGLKYGQEAAVVTTIYLN
jgi:hypothetical protein